MFDKFHEECGVFAIYGHPEASKLAYLGLYALQHRGQESAGIASSDGREIYCHKNMGHVADIFTPDVLSPACPASWPSATRATPPPATRCCCNAQPFSVDCNKGNIAVAHNGNITNAAELRARTGKRRIDLPGVERHRSHPAPGGPFARAHACRRACARRCCSWKARFRWCSWRRTASSSRAIRTDSARSPWARWNCPAAGKRYVFASETCAFDLIDAVYMNDVEPGEMVIVGPEGRDARALRSAQAGRAQCVFEHVYFSRPDSIVFGRPVQESREMLGRLLAREHPVDADVVVPVPDSGVAAALGYSAESGIPFRQALIRNHYVGRTFIEPSQAIRDFGVKLKLNPVRHLLEGKRVILVDDSHRPRHHQPQDRPHGAASGRARSALRISCPPTVSPCFYGVDTPSKQELIAANHSIEEIRRFVEADRSAICRSTRSSQRSATTRTVLLRLLHRRVSDADRADRAARLGAILKPHA